MQEMRRAQQSPGYARDGTMSRPSVLPCPKCGGTEIDVVPGDMLRGYMARCSPCYERDVEAFAVAGAAPVIFAETARMAIVDWNKLPRTTPGGRT